MYDTIYIHNQNYCRLYLGFREQSGRPANYVVQAGKALRIDVVKSGDGYHFTVGGSTITKLDFNRGEAADDMYFDASGKITYKEDGWRSFWTGKNKIADVGKQSYAPSFADNDGIDGCRKAYFSMAAQETVLFIGISEDGLGPYSPPSPLKDQNEWESM